MKARIGTIDCSVLLDTGAARSLMRTGFHRELQKNPDVKAKIGSALPGDRTIVIVGIHGPQATQGNGAVNSGVSIPFQFIEHSNGADRPGGKEVMTQFSLMDDCADNLVIGCPQLTEWGFSLGMSDGRSFPLVHLQGLGVSPSVEKWFDNPQLSCTASESVFSAVQNNRSAVTVSRNARRPLFSLD